MPAVSALTSNLTFSTIRLADKNIFGLRLLLRGFPSCEFPMNFEISCYDSNPLSVFSETICTPIIRSMKCQGSVPPASSANITCLVMSLPTSSGGSQPVLLCKGLNLVKVCSVVATSLMCSPFFSGSQWLEGRQFSPGLQTLSCPISLSHCPLASGYEIPHFFFAQFPFLS